jgi:antirestriction protein ArdC
MSASTHQTVYDRITGSIVAALEQGVAPWVRPWAVSLPCNAVSRREYRGVNILSCLAHQLEHGHESAGYVTFQQAKSLGGWVRQGERGVLLVLYREVPVPVPGQDDEVDGGRRIFLAKGFVVFNLEQTGGLEEFRQKLEAGRSRGFEPLEECERVVAATGAMIRENGPHASYSPSLDVITMPARAAFGRASDWYATLYHELTHWSGAKHRLTRDLSGTFGGTRYAQEELVAELGACFLSARSGIEHVTQSASYVSSWLAALHEDKRFIFAAAKLATQAADFISSDDESRNGAWLDG